MNRSLHALLESWSKELSSRADRVRSLIGDAHWLSDGMHKESLVQEFVGARLPATLAAEHGFFLALSADECSPEIDLFVRDCAHSAPFLKEGSITICDPGSVIAYWEVKSDFKASALSDALTLVARTQNVIASVRAPSDVWRCVCFMASSEARTDESFLKTIKDQLLKVLDSSESSGKDVRHYLPTCLVCLDHFCAFIAEGREGTRGRIRYFPTRGLSFSVALADMLAHAYTNLRQVGLQPLENAVEQVVNAIPLTSEF